MIALLWENLALGKSAKIAHTVIPLSFCCCSHLAASLLLLWLLQRFSFGLWCSYSAPLCCCCGCCRVWVVVYCYSAHCLAVCCAMVVYVFGHATCCCVYGDVCGEGVKGPICM